MAEMRIELDEELHTRFKLVCVEEHVTMISVLRNLIEEWVELKEAAKVVDRKKK